MPEILPSLHRSSPSGTPAQHIAVPARVYAERSGMAAMFRRNADARRLAELTADAGLTAHTVAVVSTVAPVFATPAEIRAGAPERFVAAYTAYEEAFTATDPEATS